MMNLGCENEYKESTHDSGPDYYNVGAGAGLSPWMLLNPFEREAVMAREALGDMMTINYKALVEMFVDRKSSHIVLVKQAYQAKFSRHLDQDIASIDPPHPYKKILLALAASHKAHHTDVSQDIAKCDAKRLYQTGEGRSGSIDEAVVLELLSKRSIPQLKLTFFSYKHIYGHDYTKSIKKKNPGEFEDALEMVVKCIYNPPKYYAKRLYASIKGMPQEKGAALACVMMRGAEAGAEEIQRVFKKKYGMELREALCESLPAGDYRDFLVALATRTTSVSTTLAS